MASQSAGENLGNWIVDNFHWMYNQLILMPDAITTNPYQYTLGYGPEALAVWVGALGVNMFIISIPVMFIMLFDFLFNVVQVLVKISNNTFTRFITSTIYVLFMIPMYIGTASILITLILVAYLIVSYLLFGTAYHEFFEQLPELYGLDERITNVYTYKQYCTDQDGKGICGI